MMPRDYTPILNTLRAAPQQRQATMKWLVDQLWDRFHFGLSPRGGISWVGFYLYDASKPDELTLGYRRDKPACSPIGLHGACGQCLLQRVPMIVTDVANLGKNYIACDPRDRSELILPLLQPDGTSTGVLDIDSHDTHAFDEHDAETIADILIRLKISSANTRPIRVI